MLTFQRKPVIPSTKSINFTGMNISLSVRKIPNNEHGETIKKKENKSDGKNSDALTLTNKKCSGFL